MDPLHIVPQLFDVELKKINPSNSEKPDQKKILGGGFKHFLKFIPIWGRTQFDEHIFRIGWFNHEALTHWTSLKAWRLISITKSKQNRNTVDGSEIRLTSWYGKYPIIYRLSVAQQWQMMVHILLMVQKSGDHQLRLVVYPIIYKVLYIPSGERRISEPSTVSTLPFALLFLVTLLWDEWFMMSPRPTKNLVRLKDKTWTSRTRLLYFGLPRIGIERKNNRKKTILQDLSIFW